jgi:DNA polymerase (family 10)
MTNREIAAVLEQIADLLEFQDANPFRVRAYRNGARKLGDLSEPLTDILADPDRKLTQIEGIGKDLAEKVETLIETGSLPLLDELLAQISPAVLALLRVPGLGPKKAAALHRELGIESLADLRDACEAEQVRTLKGFGAKTEATILKGLAIAEQAQVRTRWVDAHAVATRLVEHIRQAEGIRQLEMAGSYRRGCETVGDLDLLVDADDHHAVMQQLAEFPPVDDVLVRGETKMSVRLDSGMQVDLRVVPTRSFGAALQYFTGSKDHNVAVRGRARQKGLKVNEWGVFRTATAAIEDEPNAASTSPPADAAVDDEQAYVAGATEQEVYASLDLPWFPPEIREARLEFEWAQTGSLPELIELPDLRGDLHMHTTATDGKASLEEMVAAARARGLQYIAITDHSQRVAMARGLNADRLREQWEAIDRLNQKLTDLVILKGIECDILEAGGMDLPDDVLAEADWVIGSVHYGQGQPRDQITRRIVDALANPHVDIIAHPTGRLINRREPYQVDMEAVMEAAAEHGKMLELNANPARLDLHDVHCAAAKRHGIPIVISTDAHSTEGLDVMMHGVRQARRGGLTKSDVANTLSWKEFSKRIARET